MHHRLIFLVAFLLAINVVSGQTVLDSVNNEPMAYASIYDKTQGLGTITNEEGRFDGDFFIQNKSTSIAVSSLGYRPIELLVSSSLTNDTIYLSPDVFYLNEVVVKAFNAKDTLKAATRAIDENYFMDPYNLYGFYRESIKENDVGVSLAEVSFAADFSVPKSADITYNVEMLKGRQTENFASLDFGINGGVPHILYSSDIVRYKSTFFDSKRMEDFDYEFKGLYKTEDNNAGIYKIKASPKADGTFNALIYINSSDLAILEIHTWRDKEKLRRMGLKEGLDKIEPKKPTSFFIESSGLIKYQKNGDKYFLSFSTGRNLRKVFLKKETFLYEWNRKLLVTNNKINSTKKVSPNTKFRKTLGEQLKKLPKLQDWNKNKALFFSKQEQAVLDDIAKLNKLGLKPR